MAQFKDVFAIAAKVSLSLLIISAVIGVAFPTLGGLRSNVVPATSNAASVSGDDEADAIHNAAAWESVIAKAVTNRCVTDGMNKAEVLRAIGQPSVRYDGDGLSAWSWHPRQLNEATIFFTAKGNVYLWDNGCKSLSGIVTPWE